MEISRKTFWIASFLLPLLMVAFGVFLGYMSEDSESLKHMSNPAAPDPEEMSGMQILGMMVGIFLALFLMIYGAQIYAKVKTEKCNRIVEILATCVDGRTMMLAKIIAVGFIGLTQILIWAALIGSGIALAAVVFDFSFPSEILTNPKLYQAVAWGLLFFLGGYLFYGSLYAATGAMTDKDQENQAYMTALTMLLLGSFYVGEFAVTHASNGIVVFCSYFPFTAPAVASVNAVAGSVPLWQSLLALAVLYAFAAGALAISGKIYTSSLLLMGRKFSPADIMAFLKTK